jgi:hypothetical protein
MYGTRKVRLHQSVTQRGVSLRRGTTSFRKTQKRKRDIIIYCTRAVCILRLRLNKPKLVHLEEKC